MNIERLDRWISIATNIGVLAGLFVLIVEVQQNSEQLEAQARYTQFEIQSNDNNRRILENADLVRILLKTDKQQPLSEEEDYILQAYYRQIVRTWEFEFMEGQRGLINQDSYSVDRWARAMLFYYPGMFDLWESTKGRRPQEFVLQMDEALEMAARN